MKTISAIALAAVCFFGLIGCSADSKSIGIIGGADGPTKVIVSSNFSGLYFILAAVLVAVIIFVLVRHIKKKH